MISLIECYKEAAGLPYQDFWVVKASVIDGVRRFKTYQVKERTMMMALIQFTPNLGALDVSKFTPEYWEAFDVCINYKIYRQTEKPCDPLGYEPYVYVQYDPSKYEVTKPKPILKKLPRLT